VVSDFQQVKKFTLIRGDIFNGHAIHFIHEVFHCTHEGLVQLAVGDQRTGIGLVVETLHQFQGVFGFPYDGADGYLTCGLCQPEAAIPAPDTMNETPLPQLVDTFDKMRFRDVEGIRDFLTLA